MGVLSLILSLVISGSGGAEATYKSGTITKISAVRFEPTDTSPTFCKIDVESSGFAFSFGIDGLQTRQTTKMSCDAVWKVRDEVRYRIVEQDIFIKRVQGPELKGRLPLSPPKN